MKRIGYLAIVGISALAIAGGTASASAAAHSSAAHLARASEPGDDHGGRGHGRDDVVLTGRKVEARHHHSGKRHVEAPDSQGGLRSDTTTLVSEPGDDRGASGEVEPGDDRGASGEVEPGDDRDASGEVEPGDDRDAGGEVEPGDDRGASSHGSDH